VALKLIVATVLLLAAPGTGVAATAPLRAVLAPTPGALTQGDPHLPGLGDGGYDVAHYDLRLRYTPATRRLLGIATIGATATQDLSSFGLDLVGMTVSAVQVDGVPARLRRTRSKLIVTPAEPIAIARPFTVTVGYAGIPGKAPRAEGGAGWYALGRAAVAYAEPDGARRWFPNNGATTAKAPYDITVTVPAGTTAVAGGELVSRVTDPSGATTTWHWRETSPMIAYAATVAIGPFSLSPTTTAGDVRVSTAVQRDLPRRIKAAARRDFAELPQVLRLYTDRFGPYPFAAAGGIVGGFGFGLAPLETQTRPIYDRVVDSATQAHEIAHQWFGDSVTLTRWSDIWLHEGFATYAEWLWDHPTRRGRARELRRVWRAWSDRAHALAAPGAELFSSVSYERGGATLVGLELLMGERPFFALMREWATTHRYGNVTSRQFIDLATLRGGPDAGSFVRTWLYHRHRPALPPLLAARMHRLAG